MESIHQPVSSLIPYAAGFVDGEGCLTILRHVHGGWRRPSYEAVLLVVNCDLRPLVRLQEAFGGAVMLSKPAKGRRRSVYRWQLRGVLLEKFLVRVGPYLICKHAEALALLEFLSTKRVGLRSDEEEATRDRLYHEVRRLKGRLA